jgi:hypothetical protein
MLNCAGWPMAICSENGPAISPDGKWLVTESLDDLPALEVIFSTV